MLKGQENSHKKFQNQSNISHFKYTLNSFPIQKKINGKISFRADDQQLKKSFPERHGNFEAQGKIQRKFYLARRFFHNKLEQTGGRLGM